MAVAFFDTSALKHRYIGGVYSSKISRVVGRHQNRTYVADLTILEMPSALGGHCRAARLGAKEYDLLDRRFLSDIADGRIIVRQTNRINVLRARNLLRLAGIVKGRNLGSADALIATCALDLAHDLKVRIVFYTGDWTLYTVLREIDAYTAAMTLQYVLPAKHGLPART
jgi:hypothetical protein